jgi:hypothetical protein
MESQHDFIISLNSFLNPPQQEKEPEPEPEPTENGERNFYNKEQPKYKKKSLNKIFNNLEKIKSIKSK